MPTLSRLTSGSTETMLLADGDPVFSEDQLKVAQTEEMAG